ncbi:MAG: hypothetical protein HYX75_20115 [Acidobacteria bacterium]|nr:hypothetical protein [Acidobacteriota bacterium]
MIPSTQLFRRAFLPAGVFLVVAAVHYVWIGISPEQSLVQDRWVAVPAVTDVSWLQRYIETQGYYLGFSYALSIAFAANALRRYREQHFCAGRTLAIGGVTLSGFLAVAGCYLLGCCGSPVLAVYLNLFGAAFLPLAKPLLALMTAISIIGAWLWMNRHKPTSAPGTKTTPCCGATDQQAG